MEWAAAGLQRGAFLWNYLGVGARSLGSGECGLTKDDRRGNLDSEGPKDELWQCHLWLETVGDTLSTSLYLPSLYLLLELT